MKARGSATRRTQPNACVTRSFAYRKALSILKRDVLLSAPRLPGFG